MEPTDLLPSPLFDLAAASDSLAADEPGDGLAHPSESDRQRTRKRCYSDLSNSEDSSQSATDSAEPSHPVSPPLASPNVHPLADDLMDVDSWLGALPEAIFNESTPSSPQTVSSSPSQPSSSTSALPSHPSKRQKLSTPHLDLQLVAAARNGDCELISELVGSNFNVNVDATICGSTALMYAAFYNHPATLALLLDLGASVRVPNLSGMTALHWAMRPAHENVARILLEHGADPNAVDLKAQSPLHLACRQGLLSLVELLHRSGAKFDLHTNDELENNSPLHEAALKSENIHVVEYLLQNGSPVDLRNGLDRTALHRAAYRGLDDINRLLIKYGADVSAVDKNGRTPLHWAVFWNQYESCRLLVEAGADLSIKDKVKLNPLQFAKFKKFTDIVQLLSDSLVRRKTLRSC